MSYVVYAHRKFSAKYACYAEQWGDIKSYSIHETINGHVRSKLSLTKSQYEQFVARLEQSNWHEDTVVSY